MRRNTKGGVPIKVLICDDDAAYVEALTKHMMSEKPDFELEAYSNPDLFTGLEGSYDVAVLGSRFLELYEAGKASQLQIHRLLYLMSQQDGVREDVETIAKFQSMRKFMGQLMVGREDVRPMMERGSRGRRNQVICVYSPIGHELKLPFALCLSEWCGKQQPALFINLEELSIQSSLMEMEGRKDLLDLLYVVENRKGKQMNLEEFVCEQEGIQFIPPMNSPTEVAYITGAQWMECRKKITEQFQGTVVVLMDHIVQGFEQIIESCDGLLLLTKPGSFYRRSTEAFRRSFIEDRHLSCWVEQIILPMSAGKFGEESYDLSRILHSNLGDEIRKELEHVPYLAG